MIITRVEFAAGCALVILAFLAGLTVGVGRRGRAEDAAWDDGYAEGRAETEGLVVTAELEPPTEVLPPPTEPEPGSPIEWEPPRWAWEPWTGAGLGPPTLAEEITAMCANAETAYRKLLNKEHTT